MDKRIVAALAACAATAFVLCSCRQAQTQEISDVTRPQRLVFHSTRSHLTAVDLHVVGHLEGTAVLTSVEVPEPQQVPWPAQTMSGDVHLRVRQAWSSPTCTMDYAPTNVRSGNLSIELSWR